MVLLKYFQRVSDALPTPDGPLSVSVPSLSISAANKMVKRAIEPARKRGSYDSFTPEEKARIAKRASEHGVTAAIRYFSKVHPSLKESSVRTWKKKYLIEMAKKRKAGEEATVKELVNSFAGACAIIAYARGRVFLGVT